MFGRCQCTVTESLDLLFLMTPVGHTSCNNVERETVVEKHPLFNSVVKPTNISILSFQELEKLVGKLDESQKGWGDGQVQLAKLEAAFRKMEKEKNQVIQVRIVMSVDTELRWLKIVKVPEV